MRYSYIPLVSFLGLMTLAGGCSDGTSAGCPSGQILEDALCVSIPCEGGVLVNGECTCPADELYQDGVCGAPDRGAPDPCASIGRECDDGNECTEDVCKNVEGTATCGNPAKPNGTDCEVDGAADSCIAGVCGGGPCADIGCDDGKDCTLDGTCNPDSDRCEGGTNVEPDSECDDDGGSVCDGEGSCVECNRSAQCPNDANVCTTAICDTNSCTDENVGGTCDYMGGPGECAGGMCVDAEPCADVICEDGNDCTDNSCNPDTTQCSYPNAANGTTCSANGDPGECASGVCESLCKDVVCDDGIDCTTDGSCNLATGNCDGRGNEPINESCDQDGGSVCDGQGSCVACTNGGHCEDGNECTNDVCTDGGCANPTSDGGSCDLMPGEGICMGGTCEALPPACQSVTCDDSNDCTQNVCADVGGTGTCSYPSEPDGTQCDAAGNPGRCDGAGSCDPLCKEVDCNDNKQCTDDGTCNPENGVCEGQRDSPAGTSCTENGGQVCDGTGECVGCNSNADCSDGLVCNGAETCDPVGATCQAGAPAASGTTCELAGGGAT